MRNHDYSSKPKRKSLARALQKRARELTQNTRASILKQRRWDLMIPSMLKREICLTLEHINGVKKLYERAKDSLLDQECYLGTELLNLDTVFGYSRWMEKRPERERILSRLSHLEGERRRLHEGLEARLQILNKELLTLLERHAQLELDQ